MYTSIIKNLILLFLFGRNNGTNILEEDWDSLIILDACRYDIFKKLIREINILGKLEYRISRGSDTTEFLLKNFSNRICNDIVYVTANPFVSLLLKDKVYKIIPVWNFGWDSNLNTVPPQTMYYYTLKAIQKYHNKKLIIHFIQPHYPYINLRDISTEMGISFQQLRTEAMSIDTLIQKDFSLPFRLKRLLRVVIERKIYPYEFYVKIPRNLHLRAYIDNLKLVLPYVKKLIYILPGKTVVTSDHGEAFGEKIHPLIPIRVYGHLPEIRIPELVKVPWLIIEEQDKPPEKIRKQILRKELAKYEINKVAKAINKLKKRKMI